MDSSDQLKPKRVRAAFITRSENSSLQSLNRCSASPASNSCPRFLA